MRDKNIKHIKKLMRNLRMNMKVSLVNVNIQTIILTEFAEIEE